MSKADKYNDPLMQRALHTYCDKLSDFIARTIRTGRARCTIVSFDKKHDAYLAYFHTPTFEDFHRLYFETKGLKWIESHSHSQTAFIAVFVIAKEVQNSIQERIDANLL